MASLLRNRSSSTMRKQFYQDKVLGLFILRPNNENPLTLSCQNKDNNVQFIKSSKEELKKIPMVSPTTAETAISEEDDEEKNTKINVKQERTTRWFFFHIFSFSSSSSSTLWLNIVPILWGSQHAVIKSCVSSSERESKQDNTDVAAFILVRFFLGAFIATVVPKIIWFQLKRKIPSKQQYSDDSFFSWRNNKDVNNNSNGNTIHEGKTLVTNSNCKIKRKRDSSLRWGFEMGLWMFLGFAFQTIGLQYTTAQKSGFLLYLNVKFVPFLAYVFFRRSISISTWLSAFTAIFGTGLLLYGGKNNNSSSNIDMATIEENINVGDLWSIAAAAASAMYILRLESASLAVSDSNTLNILCLWFVTVASFIWTLFDVVKQQHQLSAVNDNGVGTSTSIIAKDEIMLLLSSLSILLKKLYLIIESHPWKLLYLSSIPTALANWIQTKAQQHVSAERACIIYAMDPVWGALWAFVLLDETVAFPWGLIGIMLVFLAAILNSLWII